MREIISVIIPVYNAENTIERCVESIINQKYRLFEIILVDDGSKDQSGIICDRLTKNYSQHGYLITTIHQINAGVSAARNTGIRVATGRFFVCVDSDDVVTEDYLLDFISYANKYPDVGHIWCGFECVSQSHKKYVISENEAVSFVDRADYFMLSSKMLVQSPCFHLYRTEVVKNNNIWMPEGLSLGEDLIFNLKYLDLIESTSIVFINKANYIYCDEDMASLNHKYRADLFEIYKQIHEKIEFYLKKWNYFEADIQKLFYDSIIYDYQFLFMNTLKSQNKDNFFKKIVFNSMLMHQEEFRVALNRKGMILPKEIEYSMRLGNFLLYITIFKIRNLLAKVYWKIRKNRLRRAMFEGLLGDNRDKNDK